MSGYIGIPEMEEEDGGETYHKIVLVSHGGS